MSYDDFDDSLDDILGNITASQLDPSVKSESNVGNRSSVLCQTDDTIGDVPKRSLKRKLEERGIWLVIKSHKHHHKPCVYHDNTPPERVHKKLKPTNNESNGFVDNNHENELQMKSQDLNELVSTSSDVMPIQGCSHWTSDRPQTKHMDSTEENLSQNEFQLFDDSELFTDLYFTDKSMHSVDATDDVDVQRSPLLQLSGNHSDKPTPRSSQSELSDGEDLMAKT